MFPSDFNTAAKEVITHCVKFNVYSGGEGIQCKLVAFTYIYGVLYSNATYS